MPANRAFDGIGESNSLGESELLLSAAGARNVPRRQVRTVGLAGTFDIARIRGEVSNDAREVGDRDGVLGANIVRATGLAARQDRPEPDSEVSRVLIRPERRAIARHTDRPTPQHIANEVAD